VIPSLPFRDASSALAAARLPEAQRALRRCGDLRAKSRGGAALPNWSLAAVSLGMRDRAGAVTIPLRPVRPVVRTPRPAPMGAGRADSMLKAGRRMLTTSTPVGGQTYRVVHAARPS